MSVPIIAALLLAAGTAAAAAPAAAKAKILLHGIQDGRPRTSVDALCVDNGVHDSGKIVYVLLPRACPLQAHSELVLDLPGADGMADRIRVPDAAFDREYRLQLASGAERTLSIHRYGTWRSFANLDAWQWRDGAGLVVKDGDLYLLGGWTNNLDEGGSSEVWRTSNVRDWTRLTAKAPWPGRHGAAWLVHQDKLVVASGDFVDDVWQSGDGIHWELLRDRAPFGRRYTPMGVSTGRTMFLMGGQIDPTVPEYGGGNHFTYAERDYCPYGGASCPVAGLNDVWASEDGVDWTEVTSHAPWRGRSLVQGGLYFKGRLYVVGGGLKATTRAGAAETFIEFSDVWSSANGRDWRLETNDAGFLPRTHTTVTTSQGGCYIVGGSVTLQTNVTNEIYFSSDCVHYHLIPDASPMQGRHAAGIAWFNGSLVIMGGPPYGGESPSDQPAGTTVWQYFPEDRD